MFGKLPQSFFDTQIAAGVIGLNEIAGYSKLCKTLLNINVDKTFQKANWLVRPLANELLNYAIKDVEYLMPLYQDLSRTLTSRNLWNTYKARSSKLSNEAFYRLNVEKFMKKYDICYKSNEFKERYYHLLMFREECAQKMDIPRNYCASEEDLIKICEILPTTNQELIKNHINYLPMLKKHFKNKLFELCLGMREKID